MNSRSIHVFSLTLSLNLEKVEIYVLLRDMHEYAIKMPCILHKESNRFLVYGQSLLPGSFPFCWHRLKRVCYQMAAILSVILNFR
jgi:hypothetical protein